MKKQRRPRPKYKKPRPAPIAGAKKEIASSTIGTGQLGSSRTSNASVERPPGQLVEPKRIELSDRGMSKARSWGIFAVMIIPWLLLATVVVLFATHWT